MNDIFTIHTCKQKKTTNYKYTEQKTRAIIFTFYLFSIFFRKTPCKGSIVITLEIRLRTFDDFNTLRTPQTTHILVFWSINAGRYVESG